MRVVAVIAAAGKGTRMGGSVPKQYRPLMGKPLLCHTLQCFERCQSVAGIILVVNPDDRGYCEGVISPTSFRKLRHLVDGAADRCLSVQAGLLATDEADEIILVHDGARPVVSDDLIARVASAAARHGAAIPAVAATETIKVVEAGMVVETPERRKLWIAQTPQGFRRAVLQDAFGQLEAGGSVTDEASLVERLGLPVHVVEGELGNLKVTTTEDFDRVNAVMKQEKGANCTLSGLRIGTGYDVHLLAEGRRFVLGGVEIEHPLGLEGHSDADVLTHAIIDALLGATGLGDIGRLYPDTDPRYSGISSLELLADVANRLGSVGAEVVNIDAVVVAQAPKLAPFARSMTEKLAVTLGISPEAISVKATTTERLGFTGRGEGIAAHAVALVQRQE